MLRSTTLAVSLFASAAQAAPTAPFVPLTEGQGVRLARTVFVDGQGVAHDTAEGVLEIDAHRLAAATGQSRGFLHLVTDVGTVAWNIPVDTLPAVPPALQRLGIRPTAAPVMQVPFALASSRPVASLKARVVFTPAAVHDANTFASVTVAPATKWTVKALPEIIGGEGPGDIMPLPLPPIVPPAPPPMGEILEGGFTPEWQYILPNPENVNAARRQCAPAAMANGLAYLAETFGPLGGVFYHNHVPGIPGNINMVGLQDSLSDRLVTDTCNGSNTQRCDSEGADDPSSYIRGIFTYLDGYDEDGLVSVAHQSDDENLGTCGAGGGEHLNVNEGDLPTFDWICDRVAAGAAVMITLGYYDIESYIQTYDEETQQFGGYFIYDRTGGHMARVWGCGEIGNQRFLRLLDDGQQNRMIDTDDDDTVDTCEIRDGLRTQQFFVNEEPHNGRLVLGNYTRQIELALAISPNL